MAGMPADGPGKILIPRWIQLVGLPLVVVGAWLLLSAVNGAVFVFIVAALIAILLNPIVRAFCAQRSIVYQGFSLLTANPEVLQHPLVSRLAARLHTTRPQIVFRFAQAVGMLPLTGTTDPEHMTQDLASRDLAPSADEVRAIESLAG